MEQSELLNQWINYQSTNKSKIITQDISDNFVNEVKYVGGLDISYLKDTNDAVAYLSVYDLFENKCVYENGKRCSINLPYISGFLGFKEVPEYKKLVEAIIGQPFFPQVLLVDGFGILHHRNFGSASHLGFELDIPTIGVGKTLLHIDGINEGQIKQDFTDRCKVKGSYIEIVGESGSILGAALKSANNTTNPIYVSIGHKISLASAIKIVNKCCIYRIPEPIRNSDILSKTLF